MISFDPTILSIDTLSTSDNYMGAANLMAPGEIMVSVAGALPFRLQLCFYNWFICK